VAHQAGAVLLLVVALIHAHARRVPEGAHAQRPA
jgi:hypothetical protein